MEQNIKKRLSGSTLKLIAMITMLIDHVGAVVVWRMMLERAAANGMVGMIIGDELYQFYRLLRDIGRIAFPIYCFLLVEGFQRTSNKARYACRLGIFALLSEIPFDLALGSSFFELEYQNVFFTLLIGLLSMIVAEKVGGGKLTTPISWYGLVHIGVFVAGAFLAEMMCTDYGAKGILCILALYLFRYSKLLQTLAGALSFLWETTAPLAFIPIWFYNGKRGLKLKYVFYVFYPLHLLILYLICVAMGIEGYVTL